MSIESDIFQKYTPDYAKILKYGFRKKDRNYYFEKIFKNNEFRAEICISEKNKVTGKVYDLESNEEYLPLRFQHQEGSFIGEIKNEFISILIDIRNNCYKEKYFISKQGNRIAELIYGEFHDKPVFLWEDSPSCGVFKNPDNNKWYGIIMFIIRAKLGEPSDEPVEVMNLKLDSNKIPDLIKKAGIYPAYHMNKKYWISISLDDTLSDNEIMNYVKESYSYTIKTKK